MVSGVSLKSIYREIKTLRRDVEAVKDAIIPEEKISKREMGELKKTLKEMFG